MSYHLKEQLVYLWGQCLLEDSEEGVRLTAHSNSQAQVLHAVLHVTLRQQLLAKLHLKNKHDIDGRECKSGEMVQVPNQLVVAQCTTVTLN